MFYYQLYLILFNTLMYVKQHNTHLVKLIGKLLVLFSQQNLLPFIFMFEFCFKLLPFILAMVKSATQLSYIKYNFLIYALSQLKIYIKILRFHRNQDQKEYSTPYNMLYISTI